jgi:hypothetical protein
LSNMHNPCPQYRCGELVNFLLKSLN